MTPSLLGIATHMVDVCDVLSSGSSQTNYSIIWSQSHLGCLSYAGQCTVVGMCQPTNQIQTIHLIKQHYQPPAAFGTLETGTTHTSVTKLGCEPYPTPTDIWAQQTACSWLLQCNTKQAMRYDTQVSHTHSMDIKQVNCLSMGSYACLAFPTMCPPKKGTISRTDCWYSTGLPSST